MSLSPNLRRALLRWLLPPCELLARSIDACAHTKGERLRRVRQFFIVHNNRLVLESGLTCAPHELLVLLPHCLQNSRCNHRLTHRLDNCQRCGGCVVGELLRLRDETGVSVAVAMGGTIARRLVHDLRPRIIVACACERDLSSGIQDTAPLPVFGVVNERPHGDCMDTTVCVARVAEAVHIFIGGGELRFSAESDVPPAEQTSLLQKES